MKGRLLEGHRGKSESSPIEANGDQSLSMVRANFSRDSNRPQNRTPRTACELCCAPLAKDRQAFAIGDVLVLSSFDNNEMSDAGTLE